MNKNEKEHLKDAKILSKFFSKSHAHKEYIEKSRTLFKEIIPKGEQQHNDLINNPDYHIYSNGFEFRTGRYLNKDELDLIFETTKKYINYWVQRGNNGLGFVFLVRKDLSY